MMALVFDPNRPRRKKKGSGNDGTRPPDDTGRRMDVPVFPHWDVQHAITVRPETARAFQILADAVVRRYGALRDMTAPTPDAVLDVLTGEPMTDATFVSLRQEWPDMTAASRASVHAVYLAVAREAPPNGRAYWVRHALESLTTVHLTQTETADLAAWLTDRAAKGTGRPTARRQPDDRRTAQLRTINACADVLTDRQLATAAPLIAGLADMAPNNRARLMRALYRFLSDTLSLEEWVRAGQWCMDGIRRAAQQAEEE